MKTTNDLFGLSEEEYKLSVKVAKLYYEDDFTQGEIAHKLGYSRVKIHRVLRSAKEAGIIQISIKTLDTSFVELEHALINKYDLRDSVVVEEVPSGEESYTGLARGAISWLKPHLEPGVRVGLGLGRTISHLPQVFEIDQKIDCIFTEIVGAASDHRWGFESNNVASQMAEICGGKAELFYAPTIVSTPELRDQLIKEREIKNALERAQKCDIILQSIGPVDSTSLLFIHGYLSRLDIDQLIDKGAVADALGCYFDETGKPLPSPLAGRMIGITLSDLVDTPWSVLVAGGAHKVVPIDVALKCKYFNVLITDSLTAQTLLDKKQPNR